MATSVNSESVPVTFVNEDDVAESFCPVRKGTDHWSNNTDKKGLSPIAKAVEAN